MKLNIINTIYNFTIENWLFVKINKVKHNQLSTFDKSHIINEVFIFPR